MPRGYQRGFSRGEQIRLVAKDGSLDKVVGTSDAFVEENFLSGNFDGARSDAAEFEFGRIEKAILPVVRSLGSCQLGDREVWAVKALLALLWARSYQARDLSARLRRETGASLAPELKIHPTTLTAFELDVGRPPEQGELEAAVDARVARFVAGNGIFAGVLSAASSSPWPTSDR